MQDESSFKPRGCRRCGRQIFTGRYGGCLWLVDLGIDEAHARVLAHYGIAILALRLRRAGLFADDYDSRATQVDSYLAAPHVCGSAHSQQINGG